MILYILLLLVVPFENQNEFIHISITRNHRKDQFIHNYEKDDRMSVLENFFN